MNIYLIVVLIALVGEIILQNTANYLNIRSLDTKLPDEFKGYYDDEKYRQSQEYTLTRTRFSCISSAIDTILILAFIFLGGFNFVDQFVRGLHVLPIIAGLVFFGILYFTQDLISIPFSIYSTFVIEERFGFNTMTLKTFVLDKIKGYFLIMVFGSLVLGGVLFFFERAGEYAWIYAWALVSFFIIIGHPLYTMVIAPLFNKFTPLEEGKLKQDIERYTLKVNFPLRDIRVMDSSRRSAHSNAYFSGIFKKRIALSDTLIGKHSSDEIIAIIAHEVGHFKRRHLVKRTIISIVHTGILLFLLSIFINSKGLFDAFGMEQPSVYAGLVFFGLLYTPVELLLSIVMNYISRRYEYDADRFARETTYSKEGMISALKHLTVDNLENLTPHPLQVMLNYSHPPVLERIRAFRTSMA